MSSETGDLAGAELRFLSTLYLRFGENQVLLLHFFRIIYLCEEKKGRSASPLRLGLASASRGKLAYARLIEDAARRASGGE